MYIEEKYLRSIYHQHITFGQTYEQSDSQIVWFFYKKERRIRFKIELFLFKSTFYVSYIVTKPEDWESEFDYLLDDLVYLVKKHSIHRIRFLTGEYKIQKQTMWLYE
jgi:hypothetical protein